MSAERFSLDTNILVYALDGAAGRKHEIAAEIVDRAIDADCPLTLQALSEFFVAVTRKGIVPRAEAAAQVEDWLLLFPTLAHSAGAVRAALGESAAGRAGYWDALLAATAAEAGCAVVLSEDMADGGSVARVRILNPFGADGLTLTADALLAGRNA
jgi:predicted nucleic acid-binding protein